MNPPEKYIVTACDRCSVEFIHSGTKRRKRCDECRKNHIQYDLCECGESKDTRSVRCLTCHGLHMGESGKASLNCFQGGRGRGRPDGFKRVDSYGYVNVKMTDWPTSVRGWIREHRLLMEQHLGRSLLPTETVHHKNGNKQDNNLSNLELWSKSQPTGQRVQDLLAWAHEIINLYEEQGH